jgi:hypothetical protein
MINETEKIKNKSGTQHEGTVPFKGIRGCAEKVLPICLASP